MGDLASRADIGAMVRRFYGDVAQDDLLGPVFNAAGVDWSEHVERLTEYWCRFLLGAGDYAGNPSLAHRRVHAQSQFDAAKFDRWLGLFCGVIDERWQGPQAERAKLIAHRVAAAQARQLGVDWTPSLVRRTCTVT